MKISTGDIVTLTDIQFQNRIECVVEVVGAGQSGLKSINQSSDKVACLMLAQSKTPYQRFHLTTDGLIMKTASPNRDNMLTLSIIADNEENNEDGNNYKKIIIQTSSQTKSNAPTKDKSSLCLGVDKNGKFYAVEYSHTMTICENNTDLNCIFLLQLNDSTPITFPITPKRSPNQVSPHYLLQKWQVRRFMSEGYLHVPHVIPQSFIDECNTYLLHHIGLAGHLVAGGIQGPEYGKFPGNIANGPVIKALITHPALTAIIEELLGNTIHCSSSNNTQIAFRYPQLRSVGSMEESVEWHTDGYRQGISHSFSLLVGIPLSTVTQENSGNLVVWPGSHFLLHRCRYGHQGNLNLDLLQSLVKEEGERFAAFQPIPLLSKEDGKDGKVDNRGNVLPNLGPAVQLTPTAGDLVILHADLAHGGAPNYSPTIRQMVYFRVKINHNANANANGNNADVELVSWADIAEEQNKDMWCDVQGVKTRLGYEEFTGMQNMYYGTEKKLEQQEEVIVEEEQKCFIF